jgi:hypothetical protein
VPFVLISCVLYDRKGLVKPLRVYSNALIDRISISREHRGRTIIYQWHNNVTGEIFVGSAVCGGTRELLSTMFSGADNPFYEKSHSPETLAVMSARKLGDLNPMFGRPKSPEFIAMQARDKTGVNNPQFGAIKPEKTITKPTKLVYVYDANLVPIGSYSTTKCLSTFGMGSDTLYKYLENGKVYKGRLFRRTMLNT